MSDEKKPINNFFNALSASQVDDPLTREMVSTTIEPEGMEVDHGFKFPNTNPKPASDIGATGAETAETASVAASPREFMEKYGYCAKCTMAIQFCKCRSLEKLAEILVQLDAEKARADAAEAALERLLKWAEANHEMPAYSEAIAEARRALGKDSKTEPWWPPSEIPESLKADVILGNIKEKET